MREGQPVLGWGLVGLGRHADRYLAPAIHRSGTGRLVAVYSRDAARARQFAERHGGASAYDSLDDLLADPKVDAIVVASPNHVHREHVLKAAQAGKHVLCEKPLATTVEDARAMIDACQQAGVKLGVGFNLRHNLAHQRVREMVAEGVIGDVLLAEVQYMHVTSGTEATYQTPTWRRDPRLAGGGSFVGTGVHAVDLLRFVTGKEIIEVTAVADAEWDRSGAERLVQVSMRMQGHVIASLSAGQMRYPANDLVLYGTVSTLRCTGSIGYQMGGRIELVSDRGSHVMDMGACDPYVRQIDAFAQSVVTGTEPNASGWDGLRAVEVTQAIYESLRTRSIVVLHG